MEGEKLKSKYELGENQLNILQRAEELKCAKEFNRLISNQCLSTKYIVDPERKEDILDEALRITSTDRRKEYGHPAVNMKAIASLWSTYLGVTILPEQVPVMMILLKVTRQMNGHKRDTLVDIAGYARVLQLVMDAKEKEQYGNENCGSESCCETDEESCCKESCCKESGEGCCKG